MPAFNAAAQLGFISKTPPASNALQITSREQAALAAVRTATAIHILRAGAMPARLPGFADEDSIAPEARRAAHEAVIFGFLQVGPDNRFRPADPISFGETALLMDQVVKYRKSSAETRS